MTRKEFLAELSTIPGFHIEDTSSYGSLRTDRFRTLHNETVCPIIAVAKHRGLPAELNASFMHIGEALGLSKHDSLEIAIAADNTSQASPELRRQLLVAAGRGNSKWSRFRFWLKNLLVVPQILDRVFGC